MKAQIFTLLILLTGLGAMSQSQVLISENKRESYEVKLVQGGDASQQVANWIIKELAMGNKQQPGNIRYTFAFEQFIRVTREPNNKLQAVVELNKFVAEGDITYRGFNMSEVLMPARVQVFARLYSTQANSHNFQSQQVMLQTDKTRFVFEAPDTAVNHQYKFQVTEKKFIFDQSNRNRFSARTNLINAYYDADIQLNSMNKDFLRIDPNDPDLAFDNDAKLKHMMAVLGDLSARDFYNELQLGLHDPIKLQQRINDMQNKVQHRAGQVAYTISQLHIVWFERGLGVLKLGNRNAARDMFMRSLQINNAFAPAMYHLALLDLEDGFVDMSANRLVHLFTLPYIDGETRNRSIELSYELMSFQIRQAEAFIQQNRFNDAIVLFDKTASFCNSIREVICDDRIHRGLARAHNGYFNQIVDDGRKMLERRRFDEAENKAREALEYQRVFPHWIVDVSRAQGLLTQAKNGQYQALVADGIRMLEQKQYQNAFDALSRAYQIEGEFAVQKDSRLWDKMREARKPILYSEMERASQMVASNNLQAANQIVSTVSKDAEFFQFTSDSNFMKRLNDLRGSILSRHCLNVQSEFDGHIRTANDHIMQTRFLQADDAFTKAFTLASTNSECMIDISSAQQRRNEVLPAISYQMLLREVDNSISRNRNAEAVAKYKEAQAYFNRFSVERYKLSHKPLAEFARTKTNAFIVQAGITLAADNELDIALSLLRDLEARKVKRKETRLFQETLGARLAARDKQSGISAKPKTFVKTYTQGKRYYKYLNKAYLKNIK